MNVECYFRLWHYLAVQTGANERQVSIIPADWPWDALSAFEKPTAVHG
jgi:hypothetical protein